MYRRFPVTVGDSISHQIVKDPGQLVRIGRYDYIFRGLHLALEPLFLEDAGNLLQHAAQIQLRFFQNDILGVKLGNLKKLLDQLPQTDRFLQGNPGILAPLRL